MGVEWVCGKAGGKRGSQLESLMRHGEELVLSAFNEMLFDVFKASDEYDGFVYMLQG